MKRTIQECYHQGTGNITGPNDFKINHRFNRLEYIDHAYRCHHGTEPLGDCYYEGYFKCKLIYADFGLLITPDLIYIETKNGGFNWFQFYHFHPGLIYTELNNTCQNIIDISSGHTINLTFTPDDHIRNLSDNSNLYRCKIQGPNDIHKYSTGTGKVIDGIPFINLYHHTSSISKKSILESNTLFGSSWNYQGNKILKNLCYTYFTSLHKIKMPLDLKMILMSSNEIIKGIVDITMERVVLKVYREDTLNRKSTIKFLIDSTILSNNHINQRVYDDPSIDRFFYEVMFQYVYRIGLKNNTSLKFDSKNHIIKYSPNNIHPNYIIMGKSYTKEGVLAPFDEENTKYIGKIYPFPDSDLDIIQHILNTKFRNMFNELDIVYNTYEEKN